MADVKQDKLKIIGMYQLKQKKYKPLGFTGKWQKSYGDVVEGFLAIFFGDSGSGKTESAVQFAEYLVQFGNVLYLSYEQKDRSTIRTAFERNGLLEKNKKVFLSPGGPFELVVKYIKGKKNLGSVFIDSLDYSGFTFEQITQLRAMFPKKNIICVAHGRGSIPRLTVAQDVRFDSDIKAWVKKYVVFPDSRFEGGNDLFITYEKMARIHHPYLFTEAEKPVKKVRKAKGANTVATDEPEATTPITPTPEGTFPAINNN